MFVVCSEEEDDDTADMDLNSSRPYSDDEGESALSKKDVSFTDHLLFHAKTQYHQLYTCLQICVNGGLAIICVRCYYSVSGGAH